MNFEGDQLILSAGAHLNCGRKANYFLYTLSYKGRVVGSYKRGREGKEHVSIAYVGGNEFNTVTQRAELERAVLAEYGKVSA